MEGLGNRPDVWGTTLRWSKAPHHEVHAGAIAHSLKPIDRHSGIFFLLPLRFVEHRSIQSHKWAANKPNTWDRYNTSFVKLPNPMQCATLRHSSINNQMPWNPWMQHRSSEHSRPYASKNLLGEVCWVSVTECWFEVSPPYTDHFHWEEVYSKNMGNNGTRCTHGWNLRLCQLVAYIFVKLVVPTIPGLVHTWRHHPAAANWGWASEMWKGKTPRNMSFSKSTMWI